MRQKEFVILPKHIIIGLLVFILVALIGYTLIPQTITMLTTPRPAELAAREGAAAFLSTDIQKGQTFWEDSVCKVASKQGCEVLRKSFSPMLWPAVEKSKTRQACQSTNSKLTKDQPAMENSNHAQVWQIELECKDLNNDQTNKGQVFVVVSEAQGDWKFERVMFSQETSDEEK
jgi:hypothetical protein